MRLTGSAVPMTCLGARPQATWTSLHVILIVVRGVMSAHRRTSSLRSTVTLERLWMVGCRIA